MENSRTDDLLRDPVLTAGNLSVPITEEKRGTCLWPLTLALSVLLWIIATTGGRQLFVKEWLSEAFDSQAEHLLRGDPGVDMDAIGSEAMIVDGKVRMYFGPFPAFFRIPLHLVYPAGRGMWARFSGFCAGVIALLAFAGLVGDALRSASLSRRARNWLGNACLAGFVFATPLLFLVGNASIYNESIVWGLAWSLAALFFACRSWSGEGRALTFSLVAFSLCAAAALLSRATFGMPFLLIAPALALRCWPADWRRLAALLIPVGAALGFYLLFSYAKFGNFSGTSYYHYGDSIHRGFVLQHGMLNLNRAPFGFADYFSLTPPVFQSRPPFVIADRHYLSHPGYSSLPFSETFLSISWSSSWLALGAAIGIFYLFYPKRSDWFQRWAAIALSAQVIFILSFECLAQRYAADLCPFLILCLVAFLRNGPNILLRIVLIGLIAGSMAINSLATAYWLAMDGQPPTTRAFWNVIARRSPPLTSPVKK